MSMELIEALKPLFLGLGVGFGLVGFGLMVKFGGGL